MQPTHPQDPAVTAAADDKRNAASRARPKPGERRVHILQTLASMLESPKREKITTAALAARLDVSEAALYRHFSSKAQMFEGLIEFIEETFFGLVNQIAANEPNGVLQARSIALMLLNFSARNPGMTRVLTGEALVGEHERLAERVDQMLERVEASIKQCLRVALLDANARADGAGGGAPPPVPLPDDYDPALRASLVVSYVLGRWHRYAKSGFTKAPGEHADAQLRLILQ
ncbi:nucleoid occlusion factor SlmA [Burkholderia thailandensis]|uniref:nucleoid occlusion factor SlmA n=1 Tax=Burkholderia thailandensis TaxID=57975 RepID=UPI0005D914E4|nr:nucleoid occlusion factor SlmA [Burkholderia thailandensis]AJY27630.1 bacterial regulatory s, tetR family protein [Burkholderia thailandensis 34]AOJ58123.1 dihydroorotate oxidase [Burkholderia thailandensis]KXF60994.1 dihydroorotate oxidase [Burkholderia thailandensis]MCS3398487.1 nucleoid occlusion factor SlmA [Burkholderia thailandensis]NOK42313.1 nucleoid occlusion factor SlmA [Burkholderia thailandensis]